MDFNSFSPQELEIVKTANEFAEPRVNDHVTIDKKR